MVQSKTPDRESHHIQLRNMCIWKDFLGPKGLPAAVKLKRSDIEVYPGMSALNMAKIACNFTESLEYQRRTHYIWVYRIETIHYAEWRRQLKR